MGNIKDQLSKELFTGIAANIKKYYPEFNGSGFIEQASGGDWAELEMLGRIKRAARALKDHMYCGYKESIEIIIKAAEEYSGLGVLIFTEYISAYGLEYFEESIKGLLFLTQLSTAEFAVRPFIEKYPEKMLALMEEWTQNENVHIRRLASEGCRISIPWGIKLHYLKENPEKLLPIIEKLKNDPEPYVQKSVANNLNEISKVDPALEVKIAKKWYGISKTTDWIVKHACRTLIKKGDPEITELLGLAGGSAITAGTLEIKENVINKGDHIEFIFILVNDSDEPVKAAVYYEIGYVGRSKSLNRKKYKIGEKTLQQGGTKIIRRQYMGDSSVRKVMPGGHELRIIINDKILAEAKFTVR